MIAANDVNTLLVIARDSLNSGQYSNSLIASNKALRLSNNESPDAYLLRAIAESYLGSYSQARSDARRAGELYRN
ncbi:MAG: hypothetical protein ACLGQW_10560, partial [Acidobacteriota bacterium]